MNVPTLEELALSIQGGRTGEVSALWDRVSKLVVMLADKYYQANQSRCISSGTAVEDLIQEGFFAVLYAARAYNPAKGYKFTSYIQRPLKTCFRRLIGIRTTHRDPLNECDSLDRQLAGTEDLTLCDELESTEARAELEAVEENEYLRELHNALEGCIDTLETQQREIIRFRYYDTGAEIKTPPAEIRRQEAKALRRLRKPEATRLLRPFLDEYIEDQSYHGTGFDAWKENGSVEERIVERAER